MDPESVDELDAILEARIEAEREEFHHLVEPARRIASEFRSLSPQERIETYEHELERLNAAITSAVRAASTPELARALELHGVRLQRFIRRPRSLPSS